MDEFSRDRLAVDAQDTSDGSLGYFDAKKGPDSVVNAPLMLPEGGRARRAREEMVAVPANETLYPLAVLLTLVGAGPDNMAVGTELTVKVGALGDAAHLWKMRPKLSEYPGHQASMAGHHPPPYLQEKGSV